MVFPYQYRENIVDNLHDVISAPASAGKLPIVQCKIAWKNMVSAMQVKVRRSGCNLAELTENDVLEAPLAMAVRPSGDAYRVGT